MVFVCGPLPGVPARLAIIRPTTVPKPARCFRWAEAGEFRGDRVKAFEDIFILGFLGCGLFGEEVNRAAGFEYGAVDQVE